MPGVLDTPIRIGTLEVPHRFVRSATHLYMAEEDGTPNSAVADVYQALSEGGAGLVLSGYTFVTPDGRSSPRQVGIHEERFVPAWQSVLERVEPPMQVLLQLAHGGRQVRYEFSGGEAIAPSAVPCPGYETRPREMTSADIRRVRGAFVTAAARAMECGFAGVQLHAAHGFLLSQFISPFANRRTDDYGGDTARRSRMPVDVVAAIRDELGDIPLLVKLNSTDGHPTGLQPDEAVEVAARLVEAGVDAIEVSGGSAEAAQGATRDGPLKPRDEGYYLDNAALIRAAVDVPVIATGGLRTLAFMRDAVESGRVDMVGMCRPFIRQPDLVRQYRDGQERSACKRCNQCYIPPNAVRCNRT